MKYLSRLFLILSATLITNSGCQHYYYYGTEYRPKLVSINIIDRNGFSETINNLERLSNYEKIDYAQPQPYEKVLRVYEKDPDGCIKAYINTYHPNGIPKQYLEIANSRAFGEYKEWYPNGAQKIETHIVGGDADITDGSEKTWLFDGECKAWTEKSELEALIPYSKGEIEGIAIHYHPNGKVWKSIPYHHNKMNGPFEVFLDNGLVLQKTEFVNGIRHGTSIRYWDGKIPSTEELFKDGLLVQGKYYDPKGQLISKIVNGTGRRALFGKGSLAELHEYREGMPEGEVRIYDTQGHLISLFHMKEEIKHGEEIIFYDVQRLNPKLIPKISVNWYQGKIQGTIKTWYETGIQESQKEMSANKKNGLSTAWYRDGSLMMIEEYDNDDLIKGEYYAKGEKAPESIISDGEGIATIFDAEGTFIRRVNYHKGKVQLD